MKWTDEAKDKLIKYLYDNDRSSKYLYLDKDSNKFYVFTAGYLGGGKLPDGVRWNKDISICNRMYLICNADVKTMESLIEYLLEDGGLFYYSIKENGVRTEWSHEFDKQKDIPLLF